MVQFVADEEAVTVDEVLREQAEVVTGARLERWVETRKAAGGRTVADDGEPVVVLGL